MVSDEQAKQNIANNIRRLLAARPSPENQQRWLADATDESAMRISLYVNGRKMPGAGVLARIAEALGVTVDDLLSRPTKNGRKKSA